jgi:hypothetical protein
MDVAITTLTGAEATYDLTDIRFVKCVTHETVITVARPTAQLNQENL